MKQALFENGIYFHALVKLANWSRKAAESAATTKEEKPSMMP